MTANTIHQMVDLIRDDEQLNAVATFLKLCVKDLEFDILTDEEELMLTAARQGEYFLRDGTRA